MSISRIILISALTMIQFYATVVVTGINGTEVFTNPGSISVEALREKIATMKGLKPWQVRLLSGAVELTEPTQLIPWHTTLSFIRDESIEAWARYYTANDQNEYHLFFDNNSDSISIQISDSSGSVTKFQVLSPSIIDSIVPPNSFGCTYDITERETIRVLYNDNPLMKEIHELIWCFMQNGTTLQSYFMQGVRANSIVIQSNDLENSRPRDFVIALMEILDKYKQSA